MYVIDPITVMPFDGAKPRIADDVFLASGAVVVGAVTLDEGVNVWFNTTLRGDVNKIRVGARTNIQDHTLVHVTDGGSPALIGADVTIGHSAVIHACTIEDRVLIGMGAVVMDDVVIGADSLVGAGSLLPPGKVYPPRSLILGSPAVVKRSLSDKEVADLLESAAHYVAITSKYLPSAKHVPVGES